MSGNNATYSNGDLEKVMVWLSGERRRLKSLNRWVRFAAVVWTLVVAFGLTMWIAIDSARSSGKKDLGFIFLSLVGAQCFLGYSTYASARKREARRESKMDWNKADQRQRIEIGEDEESKSDAGRFVIVNLAKAVGPGLFVSSLLDARFTKFLESEEARYRTSQVLLGLFAQNGNSLDLNRLEPEKPEPVETSSVIHQLENAGWITLSKDPRKATLDGAIDQKLLILLGTRKATRARDFAGEIA